MNSPAVNDLLKCDVCGQPAAGVCSSIGPISHAMCRECLRLNRVPWSTLVGRLIGVGRGEAADWVKPYIEATCAFYKKTDDELWKEVEDAEADYLKTMAKSCE